MRRYDHGGDIYRNNVRLDFSVNTNPLGMPDAVRSALIKNIGDCENYPDPHCEKLRRAIAAREGVNADNILCGNGAADIIYRLVFSLRPGRALVCAPSFSEYERAVLVSGGGVRYHALRGDEGFAVTERILGDITPGTDMVFLCTPNNPTGRLIPSPLLRLIAGKCREIGALLVVDECFLPFTDGGSIKDLPNVAVLRAFTKLYAMAGLRLGYLLCADGDILHAAERHAQTWSVSAPAQAAGAAALSCADWEDRTRAVIREERAYMTEQIRSMGHTVFDSDANFLLIKTAAPLYGLLLNRGILVRDCSNFPGLGDGFIRIGLKTRDKNDELLTEMRGIIQEVNHETGRY